jgi:hypothetical protein
VAENVDRCTENAYSSFAEMQSSFLNNSTSNICVNYMNLRTTEISAQNSCNINNSIKLVKTVSNNSSQECYSISKSNSTIFLQKCKPFKCVDCIFSTKSETKFINHSYVCKSNYSSNLHQSKCIQNPSLIKKYNCKY